MPTTTAIHGLRLPVSGDPVNVPADMANLGNDADALLPVCSSSTPTQKAGLVWFNTTTGITQISDGSNWFPIVAPKPVFTPLTGFATGASADATDVPGYFLWPNGTVEMRGRVNASTTFAGSGITIITALPAAITPAAGFREFSTATSFASANNPTRVEINSAAALRFFAAASQISWFTLDGIRYWI